MWDAWQRFFFAPISLYNVSLFRFLFGLTLLWMYLIRFQGFEVFYLSDGVLPAQYALEIMPEGYRTVLPFFMTTDVGIRAQAILHLVLIVGFVLGVYGRSLTWLLFLVNLGLMQRNISVVYGADLFSNFWLFYLSFVNHNRFFSVWNWWGGKKSTNDMSGPKDLFTPMGVRLIQIQLALSYAYTGVEKLKGAVWWEGSAIWQVVGMEDLIPGDFAFLAQVPGLVAVLSMVTVIFEIYFVFAVWLPRIRPWWLLIGFGFHFCTAVFMHLWFFCAVMTAPYLLFLGDVRQLLARQMQKLST
jgi:hypothetical protein